LPSRPREMRVLGLQVTVASEIGRTALAISTCHFSVLGVSPYRSLNWAAASWTISKASDC
jgi:hypothetical protein